MKKQPGNTRVVCFDKMLKAAARILLFGFIGTSICLSAKSQNYFRVHAEMTIKSKTSSGEQAIAMGHVYFDRNINRVVYNIRFPEEVTWLTTDSLTYIIKNDSIVSRDFSYGMARFSVFNLALNSELSDYGLKNSSYKIESVDREDELVVTTWAPPEDMRDKMGQIKVATKNKKLFGVVFLDTEGNPLRKQFFEDYLNNSGMAFPGKIVEIGFEDGRESYQIINFKNVIVDELENNSFYNYNLPFASGK